jgi:hypothetical protein
VPAAAERGIVAVHDHAALQQRCAQRLSLPTLRSSYVALVSL